MVAHLFEDYVGEDFMGTLVDKNMILPTPPTRSPTDDYLKEIQRRMKKLVP